MKKLLFASTLLVLSTPVFALEVTHPFYLPEQGGVASFTTADYLYQNTDKSNFKTTSKTLKEEVAVGLTDTVSVYGNISNTWLDLREPPYTRSFNDNTEWNVGAKWNIVQQCCWFVQARGAFGIAHDDISSGDRQSITAGLSAGYQFGSDLLFAAPGDHRLNILISEHWHRFLQGLEGFTEISMFYPSSHALAYSDLNLIYGIFLIPLKMIGLSTYLSSKIIFIGIHFAGSLALFYFLKNCLKLKTLLCFLGLILFSYSNRYYAIIDLGHTQFITYSLVPFLLIFIFRFFMAKTRPIRIKNALSALILYALIFYTSFYTAFFIALFGILFIFFYLIYSYYIKFK